jgi:hypothetical protein
MPISISGNGTVSGISPANSGFGNVLQVVPISNSTNTYYADVTTATWYPITSTESFIVTTQTNSKIIYLCSIPAELDGSIGNLFQSLFRSINDNSSYLKVDDSVTNGPSSGPSAYSSQGTINMTISYLDSPSQPSGTTIYYKTYFATSASTGIGIEWNQNSLNGQPSGTTNHSIGYIMEIAA